MIATSMIDRELRHACDARHRQLDLLVLGDADVIGRWELLKGLQAHKGTELPVNDVELRMYGVFLRSNIIDTVRELCNRVQELGLEEQLFQEDDEHSASDATLKDAYQRLKSNLFSKLDGDGNREVFLSEESMHTCDWVGTSIRAGSVANHQAKLFLELSVYIRTLWKSITIQRVWSEGTVDRQQTRREKYVFENLDRIALPSFRPTANDIAAGAHLNSIELIKDSYHVDGAEFNLHFTTRQGADRSKWTKSLDRVDGLVLVLNLASYDVWNPNKKINELAESMEWIRSVGQLEQFANKPIILLLNRIDEFSEKLARSHISNQGAFKDYTGPSGDARCGCRYFVKKMKKCLAGRQLYIHATRSTANKELLQFLVDCVHTMRLTRDLRFSGFLGEEMNSPVMSSAKCSREKRRRHNAGKPCLNHKVKLQKVFDSRLRHVGTFARGRMQSLVDLLASRSRRKSKQIC